MHLAVGDHAEEPAPRVYVLLMGLQMFREFLNAARENPHLHFGRAGILVVDADLLHDIQLLTLGYHKAKYSTELFPLQGRI